MAKWSNRWFCLQLLFKLENVANKPLWTTYTNMVLIIHLVSQLWCHTYLPNTIDNMFQLRRKLLKLQQRRRNLTQKRSLLQRKQTKLRRDSGTTWLPMVCPTSSLIRCRFNECSDNGGHFKIFKLVESSYTIWHNQFVILTRPIEFSLKLALFSDIFHHPSIVSSLIYYIFALFIRGFLLACDSCFNKYKFI